MRTLLLCAAIMLVVAAAGAAEAPKTPGSPDRVYVDAVLDSMVEAGIITREQADKLKAGGRKAVEEAAAQKATEPPAPKKWYDTLRVGGYVQGRWQYYPDNMTVKDSAGTPHKIDNEFTLRRARFSLEADPTPTTKVFIQTDFGQNTVVLKDAWVERSFGSADLESRVRLGQQDVPFGFETPQSSADVLPLERNWVTRREIPDEKDTGISYFYTTPEDRALFKLGKAQAGAPGDFGNIAVGLFNGQGMGPTSQELNNSKHLVVRLAKPFTLSANGAYGEAGVSYYGGQYYSVAAGQQFTDQLLGVHAFIAPKPFGFQGEWFNGKTEGSDLRGFYATALWKPIPEGEVFLRYDKVDGWRKGANADYSQHRWSLGYAHDLDARTRVTVEYDRDVLDYGAGGSADVFGVQLQGKF